MKKLIVAFCAMILLSPIYAQEKNLEPSESAAVEEKGFVSSVLDFIVNGPYYINIGCEPTINNGSETFGSLEYKWTPSFSSQIYFEKGDDLSISESRNDAGESYKYTSDSTDYFLKVFPYKKYFLDPGSNKYFSLSLGVAMEYIDTLVTGDAIFPGSAYGEDMQVDDKYFGVCYSFEKQKYYLIGPCIDFNYKFPITSWLNFRTDNTFVPFYYLGNTISHHYGYVNYESYPEQNISNGCFNTGILSVKCHWDFYELFAIVVNYEFFRLVKYNAFYNESNEIDAYRSTVTNNVLRFGAALLESTSTYVRIQTGFYREYSWTSMDDFNDLTGKWVLSVSVGF